MNKILNWERYFQEKYSKEYNFRTYYLRPREVLYRGRRFEKESIEEVEKALSNVKDIWCPSWKKSSKQRCNFKGNPTLYLSSHLSSIPIELKCKENEFIGIIQYVQNDYFKPLALVAWDKMMKISVDGLEETIKKHYDSSSDEAIKIDKRISNVFTYAKKEEGFDIYNISIALSNLFLKKTIGIVYPSVAADNSSFNMALKPNKVKKILKPYKINIYRMVKINSICSVDLQRVSVGKIFANGEIHWQREIEKTILRYEK